jgi:Zn-dependent alcohol dehydrogenase
MVLKVAVVGAGLMGRKHIAHLARSSRFQLSAIVNPKSDNSTIAEQYGATHFTTHRELLADGIIDCAVIASSNDSHAEIALDLLGANIPVLIEKPVTATVAEGQAVEAASRRRQVVVPVLVLVIIVAITRLSLRPRHLSKAAASAHSSLSRVFGPSTNRIPTFRPTGALASMAGR